MEKKCNKCGAVKLIDQFVKTKTNKDGYTPLCLLCQKDVNKFYYLKNVEKRKEYRKNYRNKNKTIIGENYKIWADKNKEKRRIYRLKYNKVRRELDPQYKLTTNIRVMIGGALRKNGFDKNTKTQDILGCSYKEFKQHIESKFEFWMSWDNRGLYNGELNYGWDIDHIIPLSSAKTEEDLIRLNHYTNLRPLCSKVNRYIKRNSNKNKYKYNN